jgi:hypothetical protein
MRLEQRFDQHGVKVRFAVAAGDDESLSSAQRKMDLNLEMTEATGWQSHSVRGAMAGALKKRGLSITSEKTENARRYHAESPA